MRQGKGSQIQGTLMSGLLLWATAVQSHWGPQGALLPVYVAHASDVPPEGQGAQIFMRQLPSVIEGCPQVH